MGARLPSYARVGREYCAKAARCFVKLQHIEVWRRGEGGEEERQTAIYAGKCHVGPMSSAFPTAGRR